MALILGSLVTPITGRGFINHGSTLADFQFLKSCPTIPCLLPVSFFKAGGERFSLSCVKPRPHRGVSKKWGKTL